MKVNYRTTVTTCGRKVCCPELVTDYKWQDPSGVSVSKWDGLASQRGSDVL
jgi:hypothetical protein